MVRRYLLNHILCIYRSKTTAFFFPAIFHRGSRRPRPGTRSSVRASPQPHDPSCDRSRTCRHLWVDKLHPGKNWRRASLIGWVGGWRFTVVLCTKQGNLLYLFKFDGLIDSRLNERLYTFCLNYALLFTFY